MRVVFACSAAAVLLAAGCVSAKGRYDRLAAWQMESLERWALKDPKGRADSAIASLDAFTLRLPFDASLDPLRGRLLVKRGEFLRMKGAEKEARATFNLARLIARAQTPAGPGVRPPSPEEAGRRLAEGAPLQPPRLPESAPEKAAEASRRSPSTVREFFRAWMAVPGRSNLRRDAPGVRGTDVDFVEDLDVRTPLAFFAFSSSLSISRGIALDLEAAGASFEGSAIPPAAVRYDGAAFAAGEPVRAKFRVLDTGLSLLARLSDEPDRRIQVESGFRYLNFQSNLRSASADKEDALDAFFPLVGIILDQRLHPDGAWLRLEARAGGFTWSRDAVQLRSALLDATLAFEFELLPTLRAAFGARVESVDYRYALDGEAKEIRYVLAGPFLGIALRL